LKRKITSMIEKNTMKKKKGNKREEEIPET
jgi:hypothetical protein